MNEIELLVREALARHEGEVPVPDVLEAHPVVVRTRRRQVLNAIGAGVIAVVIAFGTVSGIGALLRAEERQPAIEPTPTPTPTPTPPAEAPNAGLFGLPPEEAPLSTPSVGELAISFDYFCCPMDEIYIYVDGRLVSRQQTLDEYTDTGGWLEQRLTPQGIELLRSELVASGLFNESTSFIKRVQELAISLRQGDRMVTLRASSAQDPFGATREQAAAIDEIARIFRDLEAWLPEDAWQDRETHAFVPSRYRVSVDFAGIGNTMPEDPSQLPPAAEELLRESDDLKPSGSCQIVTTERAGQLSDELAAADGIDVFSPNRENRNGAITFAIVGGTAPPGSLGLKGIIYLRPVLPHETAC